MRRAALVSLVIHLLLAVLLLVGIRQTGAIVAPTDTTPATVEMILKAPGTDAAPQQTGQGHDQAKAAPPPAPPPTSPSPDKPDATPKPEAATTDEQAAPPPPPVADSGTIAPPPPPPPEPKPVPPKPKQQVVQRPAPSPPQPSPPQPSSPPAPQTPPAQATDQVAESPPSVRLGQGGVPGVTDDISGDIPASPDPSAPNLPPRYPAEAARRGEQGSVILMITVAPNGTASNVAINQSSGYVLLDRAAQAAVERWRFKAQLGPNGTPMQSSMPIRIRFLLD